MKKIVATTMGAMVAGLAAAHLFTKGRRLFGLNTERTLSMARVPIALSLLHAGTMGDERAAKRALSSVGMSYIGMAGGALIDRRLGGTVKREGFNNTDIAFHLATGALALVIALWPEGDDEDDE